MKDKKLFTIFTILLVLLVTLQSHTWGDKAGQVEPFRGARLESAVFNPLISKNLNKSDVVKLSIDGEEYASERGEIILDNNMESLASLTLIRRIFYASSRMVGMNSVVLERNNDSFRFTVGEKAGTKNKENITLRVAPEKVGDKVYFSLQDICRIFGYGYEWDNDRKIVGLDSSTATKPKLRTKFDLRNEGRTASIKNQGTLSTCWAYAATSALESSMLTDSKMIFDADDMARRNT